MGPYENQTLSASDAGLKEDWRLLSSAREGALAGKHCAQTGAYEKYSTGKIDKVVATELEGIRQSLSVSEIGRNCMRIKASGRSTEKDPYYGKDEVQEFDSYLSDQKTGEIYFLTEDFRSLWYATEQQAVIATGLQKTNEGWNLLCKLRLASDKAPALSIPLQDNLDAIEHALDLLIINGYGPRGVVREFIDAPVAEGSKISKLIHQSKIVRDLTDLTKELLVEEDDLITNKDKREKAAAKVAEEERKKRELPTLKAENARLIGQLAEMEARLQQLESEGRPQDKKSIRQLRRELEAAKSQGRPEDATQIGELSKQYRLTQDGQKEIIEFLTYNATSQIPLDVNVFVDALLKNGEVTPEIAEQLRRSLTRIEEMSRAKRTAETELEKRPTTDQLAQSKTNAADLTRRLDEATAEIRRLNEAAQTSLQTAEGETAARKRVLELDALVASLKEELRLNGESLTTVTREKVTAEQALQEANQRAQQSDTNLGTTNSTLTQVRQQLQEAEDEKLRLNTELEKTKQTPPPVVEVVSTLAVSDSEAQAMVQLVQFLSQTSGVSAERQKELLDQFARFSNDMQRLYPQQQAAGRVLALRLFTERFTRQDLLSKVQEPTIKTLLSGTDSMEMIVEKLDRSGKVGMLFRAAQMTLLENVVYGKSGADLKKLITEIFGITKDPEKIALRKALVNLAFE